MHVSDAQLRAGSRCCQSGLRAEALHSSEGIALVAFVASMGETAVRTDDSASIIAALTAERDALAAELLGAQSELEAFSEQVRQLEPVLRAERDALVQELAEAQHEVAQLRAGHAPSDSAVSDSSSPVLTYQLRRELAVAHAELAAVSAERDAALAERDAARAERDASVGSLARDFNRELKPALSDSAESPRFAAAALAHLAAENEYLRAEVTALRGAAERAVAAVASTQPTALPSESVDGLRTALAAAQLRADTAEAAVTTANAQCEDREELDGALASALQLVRQLSATCEQVPAMQAEIEAARRGEATAQRQLAAARADLQAVAALTPALEALRAERDALASNGASSDAARDKTQRELRDAQAQLAALQECLQKEAAATRVARRQQAELEAAWKREKQALVDLHAEQLAAAARDAVALKTQLKTFVDSTTSRSHGK